MAHVVVYLQRTTRGPHPGSLVALCLAREVADARGASVLTLCLGDAGGFDDRLIVEASRSGADQIVFLGPEGIQKLFRRLSPRHVFAPYTREAGSVLAQAGIGPMVGRWIGGPADNLSKLEPVIGTVAGTLPWQQAPLQIEPEYEADVTQVELEDWLVTAAEQAADLSTTAEQPPLIYLDTVEGALDPATKAALDSIGAHPVAANDYASYQEGTLLWFDESGEGLPLTLVERSPGLRVILLVGEREISGPLDPSWGLADFVLPGKWSDVVGQFADTPWKSTFV
ncbi:hypothetical protein DB30_00438 [Enhygromyxa salina]|uniref:Uncharacterized protein n=1 Tax=Enhygromyxa salina TaxID=215803 RepID=A0A0C2CUE8_9BACT|nr:hypothetical protein [Enhygromyxa salina]KIG13215.1 hypothetical protein DB30_00438 [Enhygromyxa salina]